jgi:hypothetical protein
MKGHTKLLSNIGKLSTEQRKYVEKIDAGNRYDDPPGEQGLEP